VTQQGHPAPLSRSAWWKIDRRTVFVHLRGTRCTPPLGTPTPTPTATLGEGEGEED